MTDEQIEHESRQYSKLHFIDEARIISTELWDKARAHFAKILADFAKQCLEHQWISVEERLPESNGDVLVFVPARPTFYELDHYDVARWDGEGWYSVAGEHIRPTHWCDIPQLNPEKE